MAALRVVLYILKACPYSATGWEAPGNTVKLYVSTFVGRQLGINRSVCTAGAVTESVAVVAPVADFEQNRNGKEGQTLVERDIALLSRW